MSTFIADPQTTEDSGEITQADAQLHLKTIWDLIDSGDFQSFESILQHLEISQDQYQKMHNAIAKRKCVLYKVKVIWFV